MLCSKRFRPGRHLLLCVWVALGSLSSIASALGQESGASGGVENAPKVRPDVVSYDYGGMDLGLVTDLGKSIAEGLENVARNPTRAQFDAKRQQFAGEWQRKYGDTLGSRDSEFAEKREKMLKWYKEKFGKDLKEQGYQRLGVVNPYSGEYFYRYYEDEKNGGKALYGIWKEDALTYNAFREWQVQGVRRMRWQAGRGGAKTSRPEAPQKPAGEIRYKDGYPIAPDHLKIPGYTGPRWVNGLLVAP